MAFFDPTRPAYRANPYPPLAQLRKQDPIRWSAHYQAWVTTRYAECAQAIHDRRRFTTDPSRTAGPRADAVIAHRASAPLGTAPSLGTTSGDDHQRLRRIVNPVFAPAAVMRAEQGILRRVEALLDAAPIG